MKKTGQLLFAFFCLLPSGAAAWYFGRLMLSFMFPDLFSGVGINLSSSRLGALGINLGLLLLFGLQHSIQARKSVKNWLEGKMPQTMVRSLYVLFSGVVIWAIGFNWQADPLMIWKFSQPVAYWGSLGLSGVGWLLVAYGTLAIDGLDLIGLRKVLPGGRTGEGSVDEFKTPGLYNIVRHPLYLGFLIAFWATPAMSLDHLVFALGMTLYLFVGIWFEEKDLVMRFGNAYREYQQRVPMLIPFTKPGKK